MSERETTSDDEDHKTALSEEPRAVFVDTSLNSHLIVPVLSNSTVTSLKRRLRREHFECFPMQGRIEIKALSVKFNNDNYHLPDYMLLKTAFHGVTEAWCVFADVQKMSEKDTGFKCIEPYSPHPIEFKCLEPHPPHHNEFKSKEPHLPHHIQFKSIEPHHNHLNEFKLSESPHQPHVTPDMNCKKKKKKNEKKRNGVEKDAETKSDVKEQFNEIARYGSQWADPNTDNVSVTKHLDETWEALHDTSIIHQLEGSTNFAEALNKESKIDNFRPPLELREKKINLTKKSYINDVDQSPAATFLPGSDILEKGDARYGNRNTIYQKGLKSAREVSPSLLNTVSEQLSQHDPLKFGKENKEDVPLLKSEKISKKKKTKSNGQESRTAEAVAPLHLNSVPEMLLPQEESSNLVDREKDLQEDVSLVKSVNTAKKRKKPIEAKNSGIKNQELYIQFSKPEDCVETLRGIPKNKSRNRKCVPEKDPQSLVKENPEEENQEIDISVSVTQSDKPKKQNQKKHVPADTSCLSVNQQSGETLIETDAPNKVDDFWTKCDTDDALLKSDYATKFRKKNENEQKLITGENVTQSYLNIVPELLSNDESLDSVATEKEIEKAVSLKSQHSAIKKNVRKSKSSGTENHDFSGKRKNIDVTSDKSRHIQGELSLSGDNDRPEESVETMSRSMKEQSQNRKAISGRVHPGVPLIEQRDEESRERVVPAFDPSSLSVIRCLDQTMEEMDAPKKADDFLTKSDTDDALLKSDNGARKRKMNDSERKLITADKVTQSHLNNPELLSQDESWSLVEKEKKIEENADPLESEHTAKKRKIRKAKGSSIEKHDPSSKCQNDDLMEENPKHSHGKLSLPVDVEKPEESGEIMSGSFKNRPQNRKAVSQSVPPISPLKMQSDEEAMQSAVPKLVIQSDKPTKRNQKKQLSTGKDTSSISKNQQSDEEILNTNAPKRVEKADDPSTRDTEYAQNQKMIQGEGDHNYSSEIPSLEVSSGLSDLRHLEKSLAFKQDAKKLDQYSAVGTLSSGHNFVESKNKRGSAKTSEHRHNKSVPPASVDDGSRIFGKRITKEMDGPGVVEQTDDLSTYAQSNIAKDPKEERHGEKHHGELNQDPSLEVSTVLAEARQVGKPLTSKQRAKKLDLPSSIDTSSNGHKFLESKKNRGSVRNIEDQKCITNQKHERSVPPINANHSTVSKEKKATPVKLADPTNALRKTRVSCGNVDDRKSSEALSMSVGGTLRKILQGGKVKVLPKVEENHVGLKKSSRVSVKETNKRLLASSRAIFEDGTSSSSDDDDRTDASSSSATLLPDNLSSSDYSEGESQGVVISQPDSANGNGRSNANSPGSKLGLILRSSRSYKKAKLVASRSQNDSPPPEFVPDSQPDM